MVWRAASSSQISGFLPLRSEPDQSKNNGMSAIIRSRLSFFESLRFARGILAASCTGRIKSHILPCCPSNSFIASAIAACWSASKGFTSLMDWAECLLRSPAE